MVFLRTFLLGLPRGARLLIRDEIRFEDVLGRHHTLPYQYFSIWDVRFNVFDSVRKLLINFLRCSTAF